MSSIRLMPWSATIVAIVAVTSTICPAEQSLPSAQQKEGDFDEERSFCRCIGDADAPSLARIEEALRGPLKSAGLDFVDHPLVEVASFIQEEYGIPVELDLLALDSLGTASDEKVTVNLHNISLGAALRLMLSKLGLTYSIRDEVLLITSPEESDRFLVTCVYDVRDLVDAKNGRSFDALIDTIISCIDTKTWGDNGGGESEIRPLKPGLLVISQTRPVHEKIRALMSEVRELRSRGDATDDSGAGAESDSGEPLVTQTYFLTIEGHDQYENLRGEVRDLIIQALPDEIWSGRLDDGQAVVLKVLPDRIVVRHKQAVHDELEELLRESRVATQTLPRQPSDGLGGGGIFQTNREADPP